MLLLATVIRGGRFLARAVGNERDHAWPAVSPRFSLFPMFLVWWEREQEILTVLKHVMSWS